MLVRLFRDARLLYIYQALKILVVNIYNCYKKNMTFLMDLFFWYNPAAIPPTRTQNVSVPLQMTEQLLHHIILSLFYFCETV